MVAGHYSQMGKSEFAIGERKVNKSDSLKPLELNYYCDSYN